MHSSDGIGRGGYRLLALVFFGIGALGLAIAAIALSPSGFFDWLGLAMGGLALATLCGLVLAALGRMGGSPAYAAPIPAGAPLVEPVALETPEPPMDVDPSADLGFEYPEASDDAMPGPPRIQPPPVPIVQPRRTPTDTKGWPGRTTPSGMTRRELAERNAPMAPPGPTFESDAPKPTRREAPVIMARTVASAEATGIPEGTGVGKCGNCGVLLLAPKKRPIRLQCPRCERVHTLA
jgi:hypothetical protein